MFHIQNSNDIQQDRGGGGHTTLYRWLLWICLMICVYGGYVSDAAAQVRSQRWRELHRLRYPLAIKVPTRLSFRVERDRSGRPQLVGQLQDDREKGLKDQPLRLRFPNRKQQLVQTGPDGMFRLPAVGWPRQGRYVMRFDGNQQHEASIQQRVLDLRRVDLQIRANFPSSLSTGTREFYIDVHLRYRGHPQKGMPVTLLLQANKAQTSGMMEKLPTSIRQSLSDKAMMSLMTLYTDRQGKARFVWQGKPLQGPAEIPLAVSFPGSTYFLPQRVRALLVVTPVPADDSFWNVWSIMGWLLLVAGGLALLWWIVTRPWWRRDQAPPIVQSFDPLSGEIEMGRAERVAAHEGFTLVVDDHSVAGVLIRLGDKKPIAGVTVTVQPLAEEGKESRWRWQTVSNARGHFLVECPRKGRMRVTFRHPHFQPKQMEVTLPHQDRHRVLRVYLASYRHLIYETFLLTVRRMATGQTFDPRSQTAREFLQTLQPEQAKRLEVLAKAFEKAYYGSIIPTSEDYAILRSTFQTQEESHTTVTE